jgi:hypothetical protein
MGESAKNFWGNFLWEARALPPPGGDRPPTPHPRGPLAPLKPGADRSARGGGRLDQDGDRHPEGGEEDEAEAGDS